MPVRKSRLSRAEQNRYLAAAQELRASGLDLQIPEEWLEGSCALDIFVAGEHATFARESPSGVVLYAICVRLAARSRVKLLDCRITTSWDDGIMLESFEERSPVCKLGSLEYPRSEVLNDRIENSLRFHYRGQMIEGMILASGLKPMPAAYRTGAVAPFEITFTDSLDHEISTKAGLYVERTVRWKQTPLRPRSGGLYGRSENPAVLARRDSARPTIQQAVDSDLTVEKQCEMDMDQKNARQVERGN